LFSQQIFSLYNAIHTHAFYIFQHSDYCLVSTVNCMRDLPNDVNRTDARVLAVSLLEVDDAVVGVDERHAR